MNNNSVLVFSVEWKVIKIVSWSFVEVIKIFVMIVGNYFDLFIVFWRKKLIFCDWDLDVYKWLRMNMECLFV